MRRLSAKTFRSALANVGLTGQDLGNLPADFEDLYDASNILARLLKELVRNAKAGDRRSVAKGLAEIQVQVHHHIPFHQRSLKRKLEETLDRCSISRRQASNLRTKRVG